MGDQIFAWLRDHFYCVMIAVGILVIVGCIRDWKWITTMHSSSDLAATRGFVEGLHGKTGRRTFERAVIFIVGCVLVGVGAIYWWLMPKVQEWNDMTTPPSTTAPTPSQPAP